LNELDVQVTTRLHRPSDRSRHYAHHAAWTAIGCVGSLGFFHIGILAIGIALILSVIVLLVFPRPSHGARDAIGGLLVGFGGALLPGQVRDGWSDGGVTLFSLALGGVFLLGSWITD
jgi:hypothetical protein